MDPTGLRTGVAPSMQARTGLPATLIAACAISPLKKSLAEQWLPAYYSPTTRLCDPFTPRPVAPRCCFFKPFASLAGSAFVLTESRSVDVHHA
jgi:hypothetical protein